MDDLDKLVTGENFDRKEVSSLIDGAWVRAICEFDEHRLDYTVTLSWDGNRATERFDNSEDAVSRFEKLKIEHDFD